MTNHSPRGRDAQENDDAQQPKMHEAPNVPEGGIPNLDDEAEHAAADQPASAAAKREQARELATGEENPA